MNQFYLYGKYNFFMGNINWITSNLWFMMVNTGYVFNPIQEVLNSGKDGDPVRFELSGIGYQRKEVPKRDIFIDTSNYRLILLAGEIFYPKISTVDAGGGIIYHSIGEDTQNIPFIYINSQFPISLHGNRLTVRWENMEVIYI